MAALRFLSAYSQLSNLIEPRASRVIVLAEHTPWEFDVNKTSILAREASLLGQVFVLRTSNFRRATISR